MNELILSDNLKQIELEINHHKNIAGQSIWEIGRRLNHVKENDLAHGEFIKWVEHIGFTRQYANRFMKIAKELPNVNSSLQIGVNKLYLIATLPEEEKLEEITKLEQGRPSTDTELQELRKKLSRAETQLNLAEQDKATKQEDIDRLIKRNNELINKQPKVIEIEKEVIPEDYLEIKQENISLKQSNQKLQRDLKWVQSDLELKQTQYQLLESSTAEAKELERKINSLQSQEKTILEKMEAVDNFYDLENEFNQFFDTKMAPMRFKGIANHLYATNAVDRIRSMITQAELWAEEMNKILPDKNMKIIEGEIIDD